MGGTPNLNARILKPGNHWILYVLIAFFGGLLTFAGARAQQRATDDATFRKLIDGYCSAWSSADPNNAAKYYAKEDGLIFCDLAPFSYNSWKQYDAGVRKELLDQMVSGSLTAGKELKVTRHGNIPGSRVPIHFSA